MHTNGIGPKERAIEHAEFLAQMVDRVVLLVYGDAPRNEIVDAVGTLRFRTAEFRKQAVRAGQPVSSSVMCKACGERPAKGTPQASRTWEYCEECAGGQ